jgi:hypothetical protein
MSRLRRTINHDPQQRPKNALELLPDVEDMARLILSGINAVSNEVPQRCTYCGLGDYLQHVRSRPVIPGRKSKARRLVVDRSN